MATGRADPLRRERILAATLDHIVEEGAAGVSHRKIAARAGVPLGLMPYHFSGMDALLRDAFTGFAGRIVGVFEEHLGGARTPAHACEAVAELIHRLAEGPRRELVLTQELYTLAARHPEYRDLTRIWMRHSRHLLEKHFDADTACQLDALIEGLVLHQALDNDTPHSRDRTLQAVIRLTST
ncbi:TetR/AcrR family transcriptional regulator [Streptomyces pakalii]|uniref:TetR family transcriptional regulator n=1 Tax=Streptomyces pakalii TaxID=3036494 RepID=A0ABT7DHZ3_9ACTN|nr:TetR family transcriptional regulator [Streptomyces pakalii]MDJ1645293.1 TetR family transcriptional regulator [Streptomyces pakalii]